LKEKVIRSSSSLGPDGPPSLPRRSLSVSVDDCDGAVVLAPVEPSAVATPLVLARLLVRHPYTEAAESNLSIPAGIIVRAGVEVVDDSKALRVVALRCAYEVAPHVTALETR
jgi:hypothetical protein